MGRFVSWFGLLLGWVDLVFWLVGWVGWLVGWVGWVVVLLCIAVGLVVACWVVGLLGGCRWQSLSTRAAPGQLVPQSQTVELLVWYQARRLLQARMQCCLTPCASSRSKACA